jgi:hypothetical protein
MMKILHMRYHLGFFLTMLLNKGKGIKGIASTDVSKRTLGRRGRVLIGWVSNDRFGSLRSGKPKHAEAVQRSATGIANFPKFGQCWDLSDQTRSKAEARA